MYVTPMTLYLWSLLLQGFKLRSWFALTRVC